MKIKLERHIEKLLEDFYKSGIEVYAVGGYVRDKVLGLPQKDVDLCAAVEKEALSSLRLENIEISGKDYGLGTFAIRQVFRGEEYTYEFTAFRKDNYGRGGVHRPDKTAHTNDIHEDAARRDFTANSLYADKEGTVIDPLQKGIDDTKHCILRQNLIGTMSEDALRIMRMVRFSCTLGFEVESATYSAAKKEAANLANISKERLRDEFLAILMADKRYGKEDGVLNGLEMLKGIGAFEYVLPVLTEGKGFEQNKTYHKYDVLDHALHVCAAAPPDLIIRLAGLLHDISKPEVYLRDHNMYDHPRQGAERAYEALTIGLKISADIAKKVAQLIFWHMYDLDNRAKPKSVARVITTLGKEQFKRLIALRRADFAGSGRGKVAESAEKWQEVLAKLEEDGAPLEMRQLAVNGNDIIKELKISPGPRVGEILHALQEIAVKKPSQNNYKSLIRYARMINTR